MSLTPRTTRRKGAALMEFAIVAPFLMLLLMGMIEFGRALIIQQNLTTAAREAAREASLPGATDESVAGAATPYVSMVPTGSVDTITNPEEMDDVEAGDMVTVTVSVPFDSVSKMGATWFGEDFDLSASASMRREGFE